MHDSNKKLSSSFGSSSIMEEADIELTETNMQNSNYSKLIKRSPIVVLLVCISVVVLTLNSNGGQSSNNMVQTIAQHVPHHTVSTTTTGSASTSSISSSSSGPVKPVVLGDSAKQGAHTFTTFENTSIYATNEYGHYDTSNYPYFSLYEGSQLVEPYKPTELLLLGPMAELEDAEFEWTVSRSSLNVNMGNFHRTYMGKGVYVTIKTPGLYDVKVSAYSSDSSTKVPLAVFETKLIVKYVKREIRGLTDADREKFLDAAIKIWKLSNAEGQAKYGSKFTSMDSFASEHAIASGDMMCDQFHEGTGFMTHHFALQNSFEAALRAIDPTITMPYYDFTIEGEAILAAGGTPSHFLQVSELFTDKWLGSVDENNHIADSRWAHSTVPLAESSASEQNSYGYIRAKWNNNNDPEVVRHMFDVCGTQPTHKTIPTCQDHYNILSAKTLGEMLVTIPAAGHGPLHVQTGGVFGGCTEAYATFQAKWNTELTANLTKEEIASFGYTEAVFIRRWGDTAQRQQMVDTAIMGEYFHIYRSLWRSHMCTPDNEPELLKCPASCDRDTTPLEECGCKVDALVDGTRKWQDVFYGCIVSKGDNQDFFRAAFPEEMLRDLTLMVATSPVMEGEMLESSSPTDPMFWFIHPILDKLMQTKRLTSVKSMGVFGEIKKWLPEKGDEDWFTYSYYNIEEGANSFHPGAYNCVGHGPDDAVLPDKLPLLYSKEIVTKFDTNLDGRLSNTEFYDAIDPNDIDGNDYVYDSFDWAHCGAGEAAKPNISAMFVDTISHDTRK